MKRIISFLAVLVLALAGRTLAAPAPPKVLAPAGILVDAATGTVLWERDADTARPMASTTKMMTVLLSLEHGGMDETVTVSPAAAQVKESSLHLKPYERLTMHDLLYGIMLRSANDGCVAAAEHVSGSVPAFVEQMNARAAELGCTHTHFVNPNGLYDPKHYSTPRDLSIIARATLAYPLFREITRTPVYTIERSKNRYDTRLKSLYYGFLTHYAGADGIKTGYTREAGHCFVGSATRGQFQMIAVLMHSPNVRRETAALLDWGYKYYRGGIAVRPGVDLGDVAVQGGAAGAVPVAAASPVAVTVAHGAPPVRPDLSGFHASAPIERGQRLGTVPLKAGGKVVGRAEVVAMAGVGLSPTRIAGRGAGGAAAFLALGLTVGAYTKDHRRRRRRLAARGRRVDSHRSRPRERGGRASRSERRPVR